MGLLESAGDLLGHVGDTTDKLGGRQLRGVLAGRPRELLATIPFSDSLGITDARDRASGRDLTDQWGLTKKGDDSAFAHGLGIGAEMLLDPLNLAAGLGLGHAAGKLGEMAHSDDLAESLLRGAHGFAADESGWMRHKIPGVPDELQAAADAMGPRYPGGPKKFLAFADAADGPSFAGTRARDRLLGIAHGPHGDALAGEIPEGSKLLGAGIEGITFRTPEGAVVRIGDAIDQANRPDIPEMLQAFREHRVGDYKVEHMPLVQPIGGGRPYTLKDLASSGHDSPALREHLARSNENLALANLIEDRIGERIEGRGLEAWDAGIHNMGVTPEGKGIIFDGGAVQARHDQPPIPAKPTYETPDPATYRKLFLSRSHMGVRESLARGLADGTAGQGIDIPELAEYIERQRPIKEFLANLAATPGPSGNVASMFRGTPAFDSLAYAGAGAGHGPAPSLGKVLGVMGATAGGGGLAAYLANQFASPHH